MYEQEAREAVARGLAWIKENAAELNLDPARIDPDRINVESDHDCVLASAGGRNFHEIMEDAGYPNDGKTWINDHGFGYDWVARMEATQEATTQRTTALCNEWRRVLLAERQPAV